MYTRRSSSKMSEIRLITQLHLEFLNCRHCDDVKVAKPFCCLRRSNRNSATFVLLAMLSSAIRRTVSTTAVRNGVRWNSSIKRIDQTTLPTMSQAVVHNGICYISGQIDTAGQDVEAQTRNVLGKIDALLVNTTGVLVTGNIGLVQRLMTRPTLLVAAMVGGGERIADAESARPCTGIGVCTIVRDPIRINTPSQQCLNWIRMMNQN